MRVEGTEKLRVLCGLCVEMTSVCPDFCGHSP